jgi:hypothetical protein
MQRIEITKTFPFSVDKLFDFLSDHESLSHRRSKKPSPRSCRTN